MGTEPYMFLGPANYVSHTGDRPIAITWQLENRDAVGCVHGGAGGRRVIPGSAQRRGRTAVLDAPPVSHFQRMAEAITFRPDDDALLALAVLTKDGTTVSDALRSALIDAARHPSPGRAAFRVRAALAADEHDRAETAPVLRDMETLRAW